MLGNLELSTFNLRQNKNSYGRNEHWWKCWLTTDSIINVWVKIRVIWLYFCHPWSQTEFHKLAPALLNDAMSIIVLQQIVLPIKILDKISLHEGNHDWTCYIGNKYWAWPTYAKTTTPKKAKPEVRFFKKWRATIILKQLQLQNVKFTPAHFTKKAKSRTIIGAKCNYRHSCCSLLFFLFTKFIFLEWWIHIFLHFIGLYTSPKSPPKQHKFQNLNVLNSSSEQLKSQSIKNVEASVLLFEE